MDLVSVRRREQRALARARAIQHETTPAFFDKTFGEGVAFFLPVVDTPPVHDKWRRSSRRKPEMADDLFALERNRYPLERNVEIFCCREVHLASFAIGVLLARCAGKRMAGDAVIAIRLKKCVFRF